MPAGLRRLSVCTLRSGPARSDLDKPPLERIVRLAPARILGTLLGGTWDQRGTPKREKPGISAGLFDKALIFIRKDWRARRDSNS
jgi:hypothetical protein